MLRRGPTAITLGESDLLDFKVRSERRLAEERESRNHKHKNRSTDTQDGPRFNTRGQKERRSQEADRAIVEPFIRPSNTQAVPLENSDVTSTVHIEEQTESLSLIDPFSDSGEATTTLDDTAHDMYLRSSPRNTGLGVAVAPSPSKNDDFHYGGFVESPIDNHRRTTSSSFAPEDTSTPQHESLTRVRPRERLPRSPLYLSQNASSSPERRPTSGLTPRVVSRVASHHTPGIIFSQPPRRHPPHFRHQTNSFSFDSSERSSAVYDQERVSSSSTNNSTSRPRQEMSLDGELGGATLEERSQTNSDDSSSESNAVETGDYQLVLPHDAQEDPSRGFIFSSPLLSPQLPLPPPFSAVPRSVSAGQITQHPETSPVAGPSSSPPRSDTEEEEQTTPRPISLEADRPESTPRSTPGRNLTPSALFSRLKSVYRSRSPVGRRGSPDPTSSSPSSSPTHQESRAAPRTPQVRPSTQEYQVYNDTLSPEVQPQTPAQLPEARHQSRYHPSYTAPMDGSAPRRSGTRPNSNRIPFATPTRRGAARSGSPVGLTAAGFQGLYGGRENGDEERNWVEGVRSDNAESRLLGLRDARNDGRSLNETPEREEFRPSR